MILLFYVTITLIIIAYLLVEKILLNFRLSKTPVRILINGTRGKTTTVKILHRLFNKTGRLTVSKTTGDLPQIYYPEGKTRRLFRIGPANIIENVRQLILWFRHKPQVFIVEGMAIQPEMQYILSHKIFRPTHIGITNILKDHAEMMGETREEIAGSLAQSLSSSAVTFLPKTTEKLFPQDIFEGKQIQFYLPESSSRNFQNIPPEIIDQNWGLIRTLSRELQMDNALVSDVFKDVWNHIDEDIHFNLPERNLEFFNLFSINDIDTAKIFIAHLRSIRKSVKTEIILLNTRADRPLRNRDFTDYLQEQAWISEFWITGLGRYTVKNKFNHNAVNDKIRTFNTISRLVKIIKKGFSQPTRIFGLANHFGMEPLLDELRKIS